MNLLQAFAEYLADQNVATPGTDLFISRVPADPTRAFWLRASGGTDLGAAVTGQKRRAYVIELYHRDVDAARVYDQMESLDDLLGSAGCIELAGYDVIGISTNGPWTDQDIDDEERTVGLLQVNITIYKE